MWASKSTPKKGCLKHSCNKCHRSKDGINALDISYDLSDIASNVEKSDVGKACSPKFIICPPKVVKVADKDVEVGRIDLFENNDQGIHNKHQYKKVHTIHNDTDVFRQRIDPEGYDINDTYEINEDAKMCGQKKNQEGIYYEEYNCKKCDANKIFRDRPFCGNNKKEKNNHKKSNEQNYINEGQDYDNYDSKKYERENSEELRRKAFKIYKKYLEQKKSTEECPPYTYVCTKRSLKDIVRREPCSYDSSFNHFLIVTFMILFVMLLFTTGFMYVVIKTDWLKDFIHIFALYLIIPAIIILLVMNYTMSCFECARVLPCNFIYLVIAVASMSIITSVITVLLDTTVVLIVYASTAIVVFFFILIACTRFDFTKWILYVIGIFFAMCSIWVLITLCKKIMHVRYGPIQIFTIILSTVINVVILIMVLQMILKGRSMDLDESDYATGAYLLCTAIIELCMSLIQATGILEENENN